MTQATQKYPPLSEAILLGSTFVSPCAGGRKGKNPDMSKGCALEMALAAVERDDLEWPEAAAVWPWVRHNDGNDNRLILLIAHTFDHYVMHLKTMSLDQFIEWVRSIEPKET